MNIDKILIPMTRYAVLEKQEQELHWLWSILQARPGDMVYCPEELVDRVNKCFIRPLLGRAVGVIRQEMP